MHSSSPPLSAYARALLFESKCGALQTELERARLFAAEREPILILGPTGCGKSLLSRFVVENSTRSSANSVTVVLSTLQDSIAPSELFGHRKGSFTGAGGHRPGLCKAADGGTLILDEINKASLELQGRLLELVERGRIRAVGADEAETVDCRIVAASNVNLDQAVADGKFLEDLRHRLGILSVALPPLRDRLADIPQLTQAIVNEHFKRRTVLQAPLALSARGVSLLQDYHWPGNIRQFEGVIKRICVLSRGSAVAAEELIEQELAREPQPTAVGRTRERRNAPARRHEHSLEELRAAIEVHSGNKTAAAEALGINRTHLYELLKRLAPSAS